MCFNESDDVSMREESPLHDQDYEQEQKEDQEQEEIMIDAADAPFLDLRGDREKQAYRYLKDRVFTHASCFSDDALAKTGMDTEFPILLRAVGWSNIDPLNEQGSRLLTIQFLCSAQVHYEGITF